MSITSPNDSASKLTNSDWELDFYSRPILEKNGKKRWDLIISSTTNFNHKENFYWNKTCPTNEVNSIWLTKSLSEAIENASIMGYGRPERVRFWRSSMKSIIKKSLENLGIEPLISRRTYSLFERIEYFEKEVYPNEEGYIRGVLAPSFSSEIANEPKPLPEAVRGDSLAISELSIRELKKAKTWPIEFGDIFPIRENLNDDYFVPGLRLFSKNRAIALAAWFSSLEPVKLEINKSSLILEARENDNWLVSDFPNKDAEALKQKFSESRKLANGYQFISIQTDPYIEEFAGFWLLKDIDLIN